MVTTFVFSTYITNPDLFGPDANALLGWALAVAGILVALTAPAIGQWTDRSGKRNTSLTIATLGVVVTRSIYASAPVAVKPATIA